MNINWKPTYIPGDLVYNHKGEVIRITSSYLKGTRLFYYKTDEIGGSIGCILEEELKPIPLTQEILEKNGWKKKMYCDWCHYLPIEGNILYLSKGIGIDGAFSVDVGQGMSYIASISFVHQLQHIFFSLNINYEMEV